MNAKQTRVDDALCRLVKPNPQDLIDLLNDGFEVQAVIDAIAEGNITAANRAWHLSVIHPIEIRVTPV